MFRQTLVLSVICLSGLAMSDAAAQWVRIGPLGGVSIRVPFVSVDVDPWGGTRVRAPFTAVDAPGYGYHDHYHHSHRIPLHDLPAYGYSLPHEAYSDPYSPYADPYVPYNAPYQAPYNAYSAPGDRFDLRRESPSGLPSRPYRSDDEVASESDELEMPYSPYDADWLRSIEESASNGEEKNVAALRRSLVDAATRLNEAFDRRTDGQVWQDYLRPARVAELAAGASNRGSESEDAQLRDLLVNFDGVTANESLGWVTQLDGFARTRQLLQQLVAGSSEPVELTPAGEQPSEPGAIEAEELPPPMPEPDVSERPEPRQGQERFEA